MSTEVAAPTWKKRARTLVHLAFALVGVVTIGLMVRHVGASAMASILKRCAPVLPILLALELGRIGCEIAATWSLSKPLRRTVPFASLARVHFIGYAVCSIMPAGRAVGEAVKAALFSPAIGTARAAALGATNQSLAMIGGGLVALPCIVAALLVPATRPLALAFALYALGNAALVTGLQVASRRKSIGGFFLRRFAKVGQGAAAFQQAMIDLPVLPRAAVALAFLNRLFQAIEIGLLLAAVGGPHGVGEAFATLGSFLTGGSLGDFVPGQLGATDAALALSAPRLGLAVADAVGVSLMMHAVQLAWTAFGAASPLFWKDRAPAAPVIAHPVQ